MRKDINRRSFLKLLGGGAVASSALLAACKQEKENKDGRGEPPKGKMTMRVNPNTGDKVSLLGYGMMRLPMEGGADMKANQDARTPVAPPAAPAVAPVAQPPAPAAPKKGVFVGGQNFSDDF